MYDIVQSEEVIQDFRDHPGDFLLTQRLRTFAEVIQPVSRKGVIEPNTLSLPYRFIHKTD